MAIAVDLWLFDHYSIIKDENVLFFEFQQLMRFAATLKYLFEIEKSEAQKLKNSKIQVKLYL